jgi:arsenite methyltransferase
MLALPDETRRGGLPTGRGGCCRYDAVAVAEDKQRQDKWADWLVRGRQAGMSDKHIRAMNRELERLAKRVVSGAKLRGGQRVLDVGAGTGLLTLEARSRAKERGLVVASDISYDAIALCRDAAVAEPDGAPVAVVGGDVLALPFQKETFDAVLTRSVLIYLEDKRPGIQELYRVLRTGGMVSIFEPINDVWRVTQERLRADGYFDSFQPTYDRIMDHYKSSRSSTFLGWDERDLISWFEEAGFREVNLTYEHSSTHSARGRPVTDKARVHLRAAWKNRPNPHDPSFEELVRSLLGDEADDFLDRYLEFALSDPAPSANGVAYLSARR